MKTTIILLYVSIICLSLKAQLIVPTGSLSDQRINHCSELLNNGKVLTFGGNNGNYSSFQVHKTAELYNSGSWSSTGSMALKRDDAASAVLSNGNVIVIGGEDDSYNEYASCEIYDVSTGTWSYTDSMNSARSEAIAIVLNNGKILAVSGDNTATCELYDQSTNTWSVTGSISIFRTDDFCATKLPDGNVLLTGGGSATAEIYNVANGTWSNVANQMTESRSAPTAILMSNGKVLIASGHFSMTSEVFDPATNTFTAAGDLPEDVSLCDMINLSDGRVLVYGMGDIFSMDRKALQVFNPSYNAWSSAGTVGPSIFTAYSYTIHRLQTGKILITGGNFSTGNGSSEKCYLVNENSISIGITEMKENSLFEVYPNPSNNVINVKVNQSLTGSNYSIADQLGRTILSGKLTKENNTINISKLVVGNYLLQIGDKNIRSCIVTKK